VSFPPHIARVLDAYGVRSDTKAALYELYLALGDEVLDVFADHADGVTAASMLEPDDTLTIRQEVVTRYLERNHPQWMEGRATASLWHPREAEGRASGAAVPLGELPEAVRVVVEAGQPVPDGVLILGRNAHFGGRTDTITFDIVPRSLDEALAVAHAEGRQHTLPGSVGATAGTFDSPHNVALLWEIQPNAYKPGADRNQEIGHVWRKHRNWHRLTLACAIWWLQRQETAMYILRGDALRVTHEADSSRPLSPEIAALHDRTIQSVAAALQVELVPSDAAMERDLLQSTVMNQALRQHVLRNGAEGVLWRLL
jgi:hypothetical protein